MQANKNLPLPRVERRFLFYGLIVYLSYLLLPRENADR